MKKFVTVNFSVKLEVASTDTIDSLLNKTAEILSSTGIEPIIIDSKNNLIENDEDLKKYTFKPVLTLLNQL